MAVPLPLPLLLVVIQLVLLVAVHEQPVVGEVVTITLPFVEPADTDWLVGANE